MKCTTTLSIIDKEHEICNIPCQNKHNLPTQENTYTEREREREQTQLAASFSIRVSTEVHRSSKTFMLKISLSRKPNKNYTHYIMYKQKLQKLRLYMHSEF